MKSLIMSDPTTFSAEELIDYIVSTHHHYVQEDLDKIMTYLTEINNNSKWQYPDTQKLIRLFYTVRNEMLHHIRCEEIIVFPRIMDIAKKIKYGEMVKSDFIALRSTISMLNENGNWIEYLLIKIRRLTNDYKVPAAACETYCLCMAALETFEIDLRLHLHLEKDVLFPKIPWLSNMKEIADLKNDPCHPRYN